MGWHGKIFTYVGAAVLSSGGGVVGMSFFVGGAVFSPRLWRLWAVCIGVNIGGWSAAGKDRGVMSCQYSARGC